MGEIFLDDNLKELLARLALLEGRDEKDVVEDILREELRKRLGGQPEGAEPVNPRSMSADQYWESLMKRTGLPDLSAVPPLEKAFFDALNDE